MQVATPGTLSTTEVEVAVGVSFRRLHYWCRNRLVTPQGSANGTGSYARWSEHDLRRAFVAAQLMAWAPSITQIRTAMDAIDYTRDQIVTVTPDGAVHRDQWPAGSILVDVALARTLSSDVLT